MILKIIGYKMNISGGHLVSWIHVQTLKSCAGSGWNSNFFYRNTFSPGNVNRLSFGNIDCYIRWWKESTNPKIRANGWKFSTSGFETFVVHQIYWTELILMHEKGLVLKKQKFTRSVSRPIRLFVFLYL